MPQLNPIPNAQPDKARVLTKAALKAADQLGLSARALSRIIGVSEPTISRMKSGSFVLAEGSKPYELAVLLVRAFRSLDAITGGDARSMRAWMTAENLALHDTPLNRISTVTGLTDVIAYLDARRARV